jgi:hypothetical protein
LVDFNISQGQVLWIQLAKTVNCKSTMFPYSINRLSQNFVLKYLELNFEISTKEHILHDQTNIQEVISHLIDVTKPIDVGPSKEIINMQERFASAL